MNLIEKIESYIGSDTSDTDVESENLKREYLNSSPREQKKIDMCFIILCGYSLKTIINKG